MGTRFGVVATATENHVCRERWCLLSRRAGCFGAKDIEGYSYITFLISVEFH